METFEIRNLCVWGGVELWIDVGKGYRVYFMDRSSEIIILLVGGDKKTQDDDIRTARNLAKECENGKAY